MKMVLMELCPIGPTEEKLSHAVGQGGNQAELAELGVTAAVERLLMGLVSVEAHC
jgi:hypothetical protein